MQINLNNVRWSIIVVGFAQAALLVADIVMGRVTGKFLTASLPIIPRFFPNQWMLLFNIHGITVDASIVTWAFFISAAVWWLATVLFIFRPDRMWLVLIVVSLLGFWYAPFGIWLGVIEIILLATYKLIRQPALRA